MVGMFSAVKQFGYKLLCVAATSVVFDAVQERSIGKLCVAGHIVHYVLALRIVGGIERQAETERLAADDEFSHRRSAVTE